MFGEKTRHYIKIIAGVYVFYLGIKLLTGMLNGSEKSTWYFYLIAIAFMAFAVVIIIFSVRSLMITSKKDQEELQKQNDEALNEASLNEASEIPSMEGASIKDRVSAMNRNGEMGFDEDEDEDADEDSKENPSSDSNPQDDNKVAEDKTAGMKSTTFINSYKENND